MLKFAALILLMAPLFTATYTLNEISDSAASFWRTLGMHRTFAFNGNMGTGKTTFIHALCNYLQVQDAVSSPTYALVNEYHFDDAKGHDNTIYHMDWYRLKDTAEAINAGIEDLLQHRDAHTYCFVEWPEKAKVLLPSPCLWIDIEAISDTQRTMSVSEL